VLPTSLVCWPELQERQLDEPLWLVCWPSLHKLQPVVVVVGDTFIKDEEKVIQ